MTHMTSATSSPEFTIARTYVENLVDHSAVRVIVDIGMGAESFSAAIVAVGPHQLAATLGAEAGGDRAWHPTLARVNAFAYESITTIYLAFAKRIPFGVGTSASSAVSLNASSG